MKKLIFAILLISILPGIASAEKKIMRNADPSPSVKPEHVMRNSNPSPAKAPKHVMRNTNPNASSFSDSTDTKQEPTDIQNLGRNYGSM